eukprot:TRINITY_DN5672_c0_g1_i13.p1 TRINITY_DN5672_c0_g1~~TRINITY_DN5672_c0_g1_i13.p1  ORF type:complete len:1193 (-),score=217.68 TRINITY_DN5672_c0_g1_i13:422-4000(-)
MDLKQETLKRVVEAVKVANNEFSTPEQRKLAQGVCDDFRELQDVFWYAFHLMHPSNEPLIRHFGENVVEHVIKTRWNKYPAPQRNEIKNSLLNLLAAGTGDVLEEQVFVKHKSTAIVVEVAKREWPVTWKTLFDDIINISKKGDRQLELAMIFFGTLAQEIHFFNEDLPANRIRALSLSLDEIVEKVLSFYYSSIEMIFMNYQRSLGSSSGSADPRMMCHYLTMLTSGLKSLQPYLEWAPFPLLSRFWQVFVHLLTDIRVRVLSVESIILLLSRTEKKDKESQLVLLQYLEIVNQAVSIGSTDANEGYTFLKRISQALSLLGMHVVKSIDFDKLPPNFPVFLSLMVEASAHPSLVISSFILPFWVALFRDKPTHQDWSTKLAEELLKKFGSKILNLGILFKKPELLQKYRQKNSPGELASITQLLHDIDAQMEYVKQDFDSPSEYREAYSSFRNNLLSLYSSMTKQYPQLMLSYSLHMVSHGLASVKHLGSESQELALLVMDSMRHVMSSIVQEIPASLLLSTHGDASGEPRLYEQIVEAILKLFFDFSTSDASLSRERLLTLTCFGNYYSTHEVSIEYILTDILNQMTYVAPNETNLFVLSKSTLLTRREAVNALLDLSRSMSTQLLQRISKLTSILSDMFSSDKLLTTEQVTALRALVTLSNGMKNFHEQVNFLSSFLLGLENNWLSGDLTNILSSPNHLLPFLGVGSRDDKLTIRKRVEKLSGILHSFFVIWSAIRIPQTPEEKEVGGYHPKEVEINVAGTQLRLSFPTSYPLAHHVPVIFPNLCSLIRIVHYLWTPPARSEIPEEFSGLYKVDWKQYIGELTNSDHQVDQRQDSLVIQSVPVMMNQMIEHVRLYAYKLVDLFATYGDGFFTIPNLHELLANSYFSYLTFMSTHHVTSLIQNVLQPLVVHLPPSLHHIYLPLVHDVTLQLFKILVGEWNKFKIEKEKSVHVHHSEQMVQIVLEKTLRDATRAYVKYIQRMLLQPTTKLSPLSAPTQSPTSKQGPSSPTTGTTVNSNTLECSPVLINFLQKQYLQRVKELISSLIHCLSFEDTPVLRLSVQTLDALVPAILDTPLPNDLQEPCLQLFGQKLFEIVLFCLTNKNEEESCLFNLCHTIFNSCHKLNSSLALDVIRKIPKILESDSSLKVRQKFLSFLSPKKTQLTPTPLDRDSSRVIESFENHEFIFFFNFF